MSDDECKEILVSACTVRPHTEEELTALIRWAELARMDNMLVDMVIEGKTRRVDTRWRASIQSVNVADEATASDKLS